MIIEKTGRKILLVVGQTVIIISLLGIIAVSQWTVPTFLSVVIITVFIIGFSLASGPVTSLYTADILPDSGVAFAVG